MKFSLFLSGETNKSSKSNKTVTKNTAAIVKPGLKKLPQPVFLKLIDSSAAFVINHATEFQHIDLPKKMYNTFNSYIKDSVAVEVPGLKSLIYYNYTLYDGSIISGDIFWNERIGYIVFKIKDKKYVNYFTRDGVQQLKSLFKL